MKHGKRSGHQAMTLLAGLGWFFGLMLAGSEGPLMPWGNLLGVFIFLGAWILMGRHRVPFLVERADGLEQERGAADARTDAETTARRLARPGAAVYTLSRGSGRGFPSSSPWTPGYRALGCQAIGSRAIGSRNIGSRGTGPILIQAGSGQP
jgi:hypothetical protein